MSVSVIIPAYNASRFLLDAVQSVIQQTYPEWELLIVDDGSTDDTLRIARTCAAKDSRIRVLSQTNSGVSCARNAGLANASATSEFVSFLDADDVWEPDLLAAMIKALRGEPSATGAHGLARYVDEAGTPCRHGELEKYGLRRHHITESLTFAPLPPDAPTTFRSLLCSNHVPASGVVVRRSIIALTGGFDTDCRGAADWEMWLRVSQLGPFAFVQRVVYGYRIHGSNMSSDTRHMRDEEDLVMRKVLAYPTLSGDQRVAVVTSFRVRRRIEASDRLAWSVESARKGDIISAMKHLKHGIHAHAQTLRSPKA